MYTHCSTCQTAFAEPSVEPECITCQVAELFAEESDPERGEREYNPDWGLEVTTNYPYAPEPW